MCSAAVLLTGIIILALPITVIGTNFSRVLRQVQTEKLIDELDGANRNPDGSVQRAEIEAARAELQRLSAEEKRKAKPKRATPPKTACSCCGKRGANRASCGRRADHPCAGRCGELIDLTRDDD